RSTCTLTQPPPRAVVGAGHAHWPFAHCAPPVQTIAQAQAEATRRAGDADDVRDGPPRRRGLCGRGGARGVRRRVRRVSAETDPPARLRPSRARRFCRLAVGTGYVFALATTGGVCTSGARTPDTERRPSPLADARVRTSPGRGCHRRGGCR